MRKVLRSMTERDLVDLAVEVETEEWKLDVPCRQNFESSIIVLKIECELRVDCIENKFYVADS